MSRANRRNANPRVAVAYIRVSTDEQRLGPEAQRAAIEAWAARERVAVASWWTDQGVSGAAPLDERPGLVAAIAALSTSGGGALVVAKRDRLARDVVVAATIERAAGQLGARIVSADGTANGDTPADAFMRTMLDGAAAYERALIRARTKAALAAKAARGERAGTIPYGYSVAADGITLVVNPAEQAVLAEVRALRSAGLSMRRIASALAERGIASPRTGKPYGKSQVACMLSAA